MEFDEFFIIYPDRESGTKELRLRFVIYCLFERPNLAQGRRLLLELRTDTRPKRCSIKPVFNHLFEFLFAVNQFRIIIIQLTYAPVKERRLQSL